MPRSPALRPVFEQHIRYGDVVTPSAVVVPSEIVFVTRIPMNVSSPQEIVRVGSHVFVPGNGVSSLVSVDVSSPASPSVAQTLTPLTGGAFNAVNPIGVATDGVDKAYVSSVWQLRVIDISDPTAMSVLGTTPTESTRLNRGERVVYQSGYCYVGNVTGTSLTVVDVSTPSTPVVAGSVVDATNIGQVRGMTVAGSYVYLTNGAGRVTVVDVSTPASPSVAGSVVIGSGTGGQTQPILDGSHIFTGQTGSTFYSVDVSTPASPTEVAALSLSNSVAAAAQYDASHILAINATNADGSSFLIDTSTPTAPTVALESSTIPQTDLPGSSETVVSGAYAFVVSQNYNGLIVLEVQ